MNDSHGFDTSGAQRLFDQLVDGELPDDRRRALLEKLDTTPDGWRQCALTFLEAQELRQVLPIVAFEEAPTEPRNVVNVSTLARSSASTFPFGRFLAMAASFLVAFSLGLVFRGSWSTLDETPPMVVESAPASQVSVDDTQLVHKESVPRSLPLQEVPAGEVPEKPAHVWRDVALVVNDAGDGDEVRWPMAEGKDIDLQWLYRQPSALPTSVIEQIERLGHQVSVVRELFPVQLRDGRQGVVPVDRVELRYVGNQIYQ